MCATPDPYVDEEFKTSMTRFMTQAKDYKYLFLDFHPAPRLLMAYGRRGQHISERVVDIARSVGYEPHLLGVQEFLSEEKVNAFRQSFEGASARISEDRPVCVVIENFQFITPTQYSSGMPYDFVPYLKEQLNLFPDLLVVACVEGLPSQLPNNFDRRFTVRCLFRPPDTKEREGIFSRYFRFIAHEVNSRGSYKTALASVDVSEDLCEELADWSKYATEAQIVSFIREVYHNFVNQVYDRVYLVRRHLETMPGLNVNDRKFEWDKFQGKWEPIVMDRDFIVAFLVEGPAGDLYIDPTLSDRVDYPFKEYAGEASLQDKVEYAAGEASVGEIFSTGSSSRKRKKDDAAESPGEKKKQCVIEEE